MRWFSELPDQNLQMTELGCYRLGQSAILKCGCSDGNDDIWKEYLGLICFKDFVPWKIFRAQKF